MPYPDSRAACRTEAPARRRPRARCILASFKTSIKRTPSSRNRRLRCPGLTPTCFAVSSSDAVPGSSRMKATALRTGERSASSVPSTEAERKFPCSANFLSASVNPCSSALIRMVWRSSVSRRWTHFSTASRRASARTVLQGTGQVREGIVGRHDHDLSAQTSAAQPLQAQHPVPAGKADVQQHNVRRTLTGKTFELRNASGLVDLKRWEETVEQQHQRVALQLFILDDKRSQRRDRGKLKRRHSRLRVHGRFTGLSRSRSSMRVPPRGILLTSMEADFS